MIKKNNISDLIKLLMKSQNIQKDILTFIVENKNKIESLNLKNLNSLREQYPTSLEYVFLLIVLAEMSKIVKNKNIKKFAMYLTQEKYRNTSIDKFIESDFSFLSDDKASDEYFYKSLPVLYQYIQRTASIIFETRYKLAKFTEKIGMSDIESNSFREDLTDPQKQELKDSMFDMTKDFYISIYPMYDYLVKSQINIVDAINYQTIEDNQRLVDGIEFYVDFDKKEAFKYLEKLKSKIFMDNLSLINNEGIEDLNFLKNKVFNLQQKAYFQENIFEYIQDLYQAKYDLHTAQIKYKIDEKKSLSFDEVKKIL